MSAEGEGNRSAEVRLFDPEWDRVNAEGPRVIYENKDYRVVAKAITNHHDQKELDIVVERREEPDALDVQRWTRIDVCRLTRYWNHEGKWKVEQRPWGRELDQQLRDHLMRALSAWALSHILAEAS